jgi:hypothetical protein
MVMSKFSKSAAALPPFVSDNPFHLFNFQGEEDGPDADKSEWIKLEFLMDTDNPDSKYSQQFAIFKDECNIQRIQSSG